MQSRGDKLNDLTQRRWRVSISLTAAMTIIYFGYMLLVAYAKEWIGSQIVPGLSWGILLGALVILSAWLLTFIYVRWANATYDVHVQRIKDEHPHD
ncbi:DUF485 domain-containing protein [Candidatus Sumerlaeota bacterium]|nr:DUF485 domain-containing protein [Candidatus Sumerlaeota bacterium]